VAHEVEVSARALKTRIHLTTSDMRALTARIENHPTSLSDNHTARTQTDIVDLVIAHEAEKATALRNLADGRAEIERVRACELVLSATWRGRGFT
jgi:hypothetical protein